MPQIHPIQDSFVEVEASSEAFAELFYRHLFDLAPELQPHFENVDMASQGTMVIQAVRVAVKAIEDFEQVRPMLESLGHRHANYGVQPAFYDTAAEAFVRALKETLSFDLDEPLERQWREILGTITSTMSRGAETIAKRMASHGRPMRSVQTEGQPQDAYTARFRPVDDDAHLDLYAQANAVNLPKSISVTYESEKTVSAAPLQTILDVSLQNGIPHTCVCGALGKCSTCRVAVLEGLDHCLPRNQTETKMAGLKGFPPEIRLACQTRITGPVMLKRLVHDASDIDEAANTGSDQVGKEMPLAVMFADIRGFTSFTESNLAYDIVHALNRYFDVIGGAIDDNEGFIDKYLGDGIMALFGLNTQRRTHPCVDAVTAALAALSGLGSVNAYLRDHLDHSFNIVVGIDFGSVIVGEVGFAKRRQFTAIGDVVNTAARLETEAKRQGVSILVSDAVRRNLPDGLCQFDARHDLNLRGKSDVLSAYAVATVPQLDGAAWPIQRLNEWH